MHNIFYAAPFMKDMMFLMPQVWVHDYYAAQTLYCFLSILTVSNDKTQN